MSISSSVGQGATPLHNSRKTFQAKMYQHVDMLEASGIHGNWIYRRNLVLRAQKQLGCRWPQNIAAVFVCTEQPVFLCKFFAQVSLRKFSEQVSASKFSEEVSLGKTEDLGPLARNEWICSGFKIHNCHESFLQHFDSRKKP